jgi:predicted transposase YbfD/YdcC
VGLWALLDILADRCGDLAGRQVKIDGKDLRGTAAAATAQETVHVLCARVREAGISAGQVMCRKKSKEPEARPRLLELLEIEGTLVSLDAMGPIDPSPRTSMKPGATTSSASRPTRRRRWVRWRPVSPIWCKRRLGYRRRHRRRRPPRSAARPGPLGEGRSISLSHGRYGQRLCPALDELDFFHKSWKWVALRRVERLIRTTCRGARREDPSVETRSYPSRLTAAAPRLAKQIREHRAVESFHHLPDLTFDEDRCPVRERTAARNLCILRGMSDRTLRNRPPKSSIRSKRKRAALDPTSIRPFAPNSPPPLPVILVRKPSFSDRVPIR